MPCLSRSLPMLCEMGSGQLQRCRLQTCIVRFGGLSHEENAACLETDLLASTLLLPMFCLHGRYQRTRWKRGVKSRTALSSAPGEDCRFWRRYRVISARAHRIQDALWHTSAPVPLSSTARLLREQCRSRWMSATRGNWTLRDAFLHRRF